jgi:hypothetical protein
MDVDQHVIDYDAPVPSVDDAPLHLLPIVHLSVERVKDDLWQT